METLLEKEVVDLYQEHELHTFYNKKCSTCFNAICKDCGGLGEVSYMDNVYHGEPHQAMVGSEVCGNCHGYGFEVDEQILEERKQ